MTIAFENFLAQYHATGSEKADGYFPDAFDGLSESEKDVVFKLLETELPFSVKWLFVVDPARAYEVVSAEEARMRGDSYMETYLMQEQLVKHSGDMQYLKRMLEDYPIYIDRLKPSVVNTVGRLPVNQDAIDFFKKVILFETNGDAVFHAARQLLIALEFPRQSDDEKQQYRQLLKHLTDESFDVRSRAIDRIS
jgi:hypothetical protein